jgi:hypothetical protein
MFRSPRFSFDPVVWMQTVRNGGITFLRPEPATAGAARARDPTTTSAGDNA